MAAAISAGKLKERWTSSIRYWYSPFNVVQLDLFEQLLTGDHPLYHRLVYVAHQRSIELPSSVKPSGRVEGPWCHASRDLFVIKHFRHQSPASVYTE